MKDMLRRSKYLTRLRALVTKKHRQMENGRHQLRLRFETLETRRLLTTTAIASGDWDDPSTWNAGVPDDSQRAVIPSGITVTLGGTDHVAQELVIHGILNVAESTGADFDGSGTVDGFDFLAWQRGNGDADGDSDSDNVDLDLWQQQYGTEGTGGGQTKTLTTDWIHVNSGGVFQIGTETNRYDQGEFVLTLTGTDQNADYTVETSTGTMQITDNGGFLMAAMGGRLQFFGEDKLSFTKLGQTAEVGANSIVVENVIERNFDGTTSAASDGQLNWEVGDEIVIASSSRDYSDQEVRTINAITDLGNGTTRLTLNAILSNRHYGEIETYGNGTRTWDVDMRAEVALLSRNVRIQGLASQDTDSNWGNRALFNTGSTGDHRGISGHIMIMGTAGQISVEGVQLDRLGQTGTLGRYPIHWHLAGDRTGDVLKGVSVTNSNNRGVTVHGTHNLLIQDVVLHDVHGHGFFMEDGVETGNEYIANIAFGIHKVGRSDAVGNFAPDLNDPFIVDTHDHVGQNANRFLSSSAYWITNPDNTWIGNISAGVDGTGFWFILPEEAIGASADDPQYANVDPSRTNLRQFDHNWSHSSHVGLNFDRGSDIEVPVGGTLKSFFDGDEWRPPQEPQINYFTAYKHHVGNYHRGQIANFHENRYVDSFTSTFITFTQRVTDTLYVGHSQGNANLSDTVTGHTIYDGASTLDGNHFAGYSANNAHTFRTHNAANRFTSHQFSNTSFENDGTAANVSIAAQEGTLSGGTFGSHDVFGHSASAIYDVDGTLTGHVGGGPGYTVVTDHPFFYDSSDIRPAGWSAVVSDDLYAQVLFNIGANFIFTSPDGDAGQATYDNYNTHVKTNDGDYVVSFPGGAGSVSGGFSVKHFQRVGLNNGSTVIRFAGIGNVLAPSGIPRVSGLTALRNSNVTAYEVVGSDLYVKFFSDNNDVDFVPDNSTPPPDGLLVSAVDDAYIQDSSTLNSNILYVESSGSRTRTSYLKFDVPDTPENIIGATLQLTVTQDAGNNLRIRVYEGGSNNWTETTLTPANAPAKTTLLDDITGNFVIGQTYVFDVSAAVVAGEEVTFVVDSDGATSGGDAAFASSENSDSAIRPLLVVEVEDTSSSVTLWDDPSPDDNSNSTAVTRINDPFGTGMGGIGQWVTNGQPTYHNIGAGSPLDVSSYNGWTYVFSFDYYVDSSQPLTDDQFYQQVYDSSSATNFIDIGGSAALDEWTNVVTTGTITGSTITPFIIVNHKSTTESIPSLYIDNINFSINSPAITIAGAESESPSPLEVAVSTQEQPFAVGDLAGIGLNGEIVGNEDSEERRSVDLHPVPRAVLLSSSNASRDRALAALDFVKRDTSIPESLETAEGEEKKLVDELFESVFDLADVRIL